LPEKGTIKIAFSRRSEPAKPSRQTLWRKILAKANKNRCTLTRINCPPIEFCSRTLVKKLLFSRCDNIKANIKSTITSQTI